MTDLRDFRCNVCDDPMGSGHDEPRECIAYLKTFVRRLKEERDSYEMQLDLAEKQEEKLVDRVTEGEKRAEEYEDKVPMMLKILERVKVFRNLEDATHAKQLIEFFWSRKA